MDKPNSKDSPPKVENACPYDVAAYCDIPCTCEECAASENEWMERWQNQGNIRCEVKERL